MTTAWSCRSMSTIMSDHQHVGRFLYDAMENCLKKQGFLNLNACIAAPIGEDPYLDDNSIRFHEHLGYNFVGRFHQ